MWEEESKKESFTKKTLCETENTEQKPTGENKTYQSGGKFHTHALLLPMWYTIWNIQTN